MAIAAFDIGGSAVKYAAISEQGEIRDRGSIPTPPDRASFYDGLQHIADDLKTRHEITGAAFSMPGAVDDRRGVIGGTSMVPYIHDFPIREELSAKLSLPCAMENDANCAALGETWLGAAAGASDVVFLVIGSGVGGAIVKDGRIHHGQHLHGGEFGFMVVDDKGTTLSEAASTRGMVRYVERLKQLAEGTLDGKQAFSLADAGDRDAQLGIERMIAHLARAIYNVQYAVDPSCIIIGGGVSERTGFVEAIAEEAERLRVQVGYARIAVDVRPAQYGNDANLLGSVRHFLTRG